MPEKTAGCGALPAAPLCEAIHRAKRRRRGETAEGICKEIGLTSRHLRRWEEGWCPTVSLDTFDTICTRLHMLWFDVYNEDTVRKPVVTVQMYQPFGFENHPVTGRVWETNGEVYVAPAGVEPTVRYRLKDGGYVRKPRKRNGVKCGYERGVRAYGDLGVDTVTLANIEGLMEPAVMELEIAA